MISFKRTSGPRLPKIEQHSFDSIDLTKTATELLRILKIDRTLDSIVDWINLDQLRCFDTLKQSRDYLMKVLFFSRWVTLPESIRAEIEFERFVLRNLINPDYRTQIYSKSGDICNMIRGAWS
ncbi:hypothetical protein [Vibrio sinus]